MSDLGLSSTNQQLFDLTHTAGVTGILEGAVVCCDPSGGVGRKAILPAGAGAKNVRGVCKTDWGPSGVPLNRDFEVSVHGVVGVLLAAGQTCSIGDEAITANSSGHTKVFTTEDDCDVIGEYLEDRTAGSSPLLVPLLLRQRRIPASS